MHAEVLGDHALISVWNGSGKAVVYLVWWKTGAVIFVSDLGSIFLVFHSHKPLKLRELPGRPRTFQDGKSTAVSINRSLVCLIRDLENRLEICKLDLDPVPRLRTLCFLELPPLALRTSNVFSGSYKKWVPTSKSYVRTKSSRGHHVPFYTSEVSTIALHFRYHTPAQFPTSYALIISVEALVSAIQTDLRNVPWEDWGPPSTHFFKMAATELIPLGPFWIIDGRPPVARQYDLLRTRHTQLMAGDKPSFQSRPPISDLTNIFQYDIKTHLSYRDVMIENKDFYKNSDYIVLADREWVVGLTWKPLVRATLVQMVGGFQCESNHPHSHRQDSYDVTVYHIN